jgi:hypothetical protein
MLELLNVGVEDAKSSAVFPLQNLLCLASALYKQFSKVAESLINYVMCRFFKSNKKIITVLVFEGRVISLNLLEIMKENNKIFQEVTLIHQLS